MDIVLCREVSNSKYSVFQESASSPGSSAEAPVKAPCVDTVGERNDISGGFLSVQVPPVVISTLISTCSKASASHVDVLTCQSDGGNCVQGTGARPPFRCSSGVHVHQHRTGPPPPAPQLRLPLSGCDGAQLFSLHRG